MGIRLGSALVALVVPIVATAAVGVDEPEDARRFTDSLVVRELEVYFDDSVLPPLGSIGKRGDDDFTVLEEGRPLDRIGAVGEGGDPPPREVVAWFDPALATPAALAAAARSLAEAASGIPLGDGVTIVEVDPRPAERLRTQRPETLALELNTLARRWESSSRGEPSLEARLRAIDRLTCWIGARGGGGPRAILIAGDGWRVDAALLNQLAELSHTDEPGDLRLAAIERGARVLAAWGWVPYALVARELRDRSRALRSWREAETVGVGDGTSHRFPLFRFPFRRAEPPARAAAKLELATDFGLRPLAHLVRAGAGTLIGDPKSIHGELARLSHRRRLVVRSPDPGPGRLLPLEVRWSGGDGRALPSPRWSRSGSPPELSRARLAALAAGDLGTADGLALVLRREPAGGGERLCLPGGIARGPLRRSIRREGDGEPEIRSERVDAAPKAESPGCVPISNPDPGSSRTSSWWLVEDVETGEWGAVATSLGGT